MRVLVTWGSKRGGTDGIGRMIAATLQERGHHVVALPAESAPRPDGFDAVIVGGALHANRWPSAVRRFVQRNVRSLRERPVWLFSSGPLDDSADRSDIPPPNGVAALAERIGANGHTTFGGVLAPDTNGFPAAAMAKTHGGDFRNPTRIHAWAAELADALPCARPGHAIDHAAHSLVRLFAHGLVGWALCAATMAGLLALGSPTAALAVHAVVAPLFFTAIAIHYFRARGARDALPTAIAWTAMLLALDLAVVAGAVLRSLDMLTSIAGTWLPLTLVFLASWATGAMMSTMPWPKPKPSTNGTTPLTTG